MDTHINSNPLYFRAQTNLSFLCAMSMKCQQDVTMRGCICPLVGSL